MSMVGRVRGVDPKGTVGGIDAAVSKLKSALSKMSGGSLDFTNVTDDPTGFSFDGIVQGNVKLSAVNNWSTSLYYGISDAADKLGFSGTTASSILKFANTMASVAGYTLGGTGPASKKMYQGSNLNGFNVQFKWYTPYMDGWQDAIKILTILAWPTAIDAKLQPSGANEATDPSKMTDEERAQLQKYKELVAALQSHSSDIARLKAMKNVPDAKATGFKSNFPELVDLFHRRYEVDPPQILEGDFNDDLDKSLDKDKKIIDKIKANKSVDYTAAEVGAMGWHQAGFVDTIVEHPITSLLAHSSIFMRMACNSDAAERAKASAAYTAKNGTDALGGLAELASIPGDLITGLKDSIAVNPPKVALDIGVLNGDNLEVKYSFAPLVITSFSIDASRETVGDKPIIITVDVGFDYYLINANGSQGAIATKQMFAGLPIFRRD